MTLSLVNPFTYLYRRIKQFRFWGYRKEDLPKYLQRFYCECCRKKCDKSYLINKKYNKII